MSALTVYVDDAPDTPLLHTDDAERITATLAEHGVRFERWDASVPLPPKPTPEHIAEAYQAPIDRLMAEGGYQTFDVISLDPDHPDREALRRKFLDEHTHGEDEVRFFVEGAGLFCLHLGDKVLQVRCEKRDLISVPAGTKHWFDMGPRPHFVAIRIFNNPEGWVAKFTGNAIAADFPRFE